MPQVTFEPIRLLATYSRPELAEIWGYEGYQAIARGVVTPANSNLIILFVTREKQQSAEQYDDRLEGGQLRWEGPTDHFAENRIVAADDSGDEVHLFYRERHHSEFTYYGRLQLEDHTPLVGEPSRFTFRLRDVPVQR